MLCRTWTCVLQLAATPFAAEVHSLPSFGAPLTRHFSGFVEVDEASGTNLFYYLVESQRDPSSDPLVWWMNGGPGASSLIGLFAETGPLILNEDQQLFQNPFAWNRQANLLYVEFGPGVGYSYCANSSRSDVECRQADAECSPCGASDSSTTEQNVRFLRRFLELHPSFQGRPLFLAGESYAGIYGPALAWALIEAFEDRRLVNLAGVWVTDPCTDNWAQSGWLDMGPDFCYHEGMITADVYDAITSPMLGCIAGKTPAGDTIRRTYSQFCRYAWRLYDIATAGQGGSVHPPQVPGLPAYLDPLNAYGAAGEVDVAAYLGRPDVRAALNAAATPNLVYHSELGNNGYRNYVREHEACGDVPGVPGPSMLDVYHRILGARRSGRASAAGLRTILVSSGEEDPVVAMEGTETAVRALGFEAVPGGVRRPWFYNTSAMPVQILADAPIQWGQGLRVRSLGVQAGGFVTNFDTRVEGVSFSFVSVKRSGHMVPTYAPTRALQILNLALLQGELLAPLLPGDWSDMSDEAFYGWHSPQGGAFSAWARTAMASAKQVSWWRPPAPLQLPSFSSVGGPDHSSTSIFVVGFVAGAFGATAAMYLSRCQRLGTTHGPAQEPLL